jgi:hypothetical protein
MTRGCVPPVSALVLRNRGAGPFGLLNLVDERCGGVFDDIEQVIPAAEREAFMPRYTAAAGLAIEALNTAPPTIPPGARVRGGALNAARVAARGVRRACDREGARAVRAASAVVSHAPTRIGAHVRSSRHTARASIALPSPTGPMLSAVLALTLT